MDKSHIDGEMSAGLDASEGAGSPRRSTDIPAMSLIPVAASPERSAPQRADWIGVMSVCYPEGTVRHPSVLQLVAEELGYACLVDNRYEGLRLAFDLQSESESSAAAEAEEVAAHLLRLLGLEPEDLTETRLFRPTTPPLDEHGQHLKLVTP